MDSYDLIVIGSGPGGYPAAAKAAESGLRVMIAERDSLGGTCLNRGCIPTKALCRTADIAMSLSSAKTFGITATDIAIDYLQAVSRKNEVVSSLQEAVTSILSKVNIVKGEAGFISPHVIEVNGNCYTAPKIIIATGSRPAKLDIPGAETAINSDEFLSATSLPNSAVIIGGGVIGMEFASILNALGTQVTVLEYCREILPGFDTDVAKRLRMTLKRRGVTIITSAEVTSIESGHKVAYQYKSKTTTVEAETVIMTVGRTPVIPKGLAELGIEMSRGAITVNNDMSTSLPGIYAVGDVNGRCLLAHAATAQGQIAIGIKKPSNVIPAAVFTVPECAAVGLTENECVTTGIDYITGQASFRANGKALAMGEPDGLVKVIADRTTRRLIGCHICGAHAADLIAEPTLAINNNLTIDEITETIHAHPTLSETLVTAIGNAK